MNKIYFLAFYANFSFVISELDYLDKVSLSTAMHGYTTRDEPLETFFNSDHCQSHQSQAFFDGLM